MIYKAYGTKYDNFIELLVEKEDINRYKAFQIISKKKNIEAEIPKEAMHLLNHAYINALCEIVIHSQTEEEVKISGAQCRCLVSAWVSA